MQLNSASNRERMMQEDMGDYVAHLQLHMSLQAKNLVSNDSQLQSLLQQAQADVEKQVSRQSSL